MRLDPNNPYDVYFALRLAFVDRPDVRIRTQERAVPSHSRFAPDPTLWCVDAFVEVDKDDECTCQVDWTTEPPCSPACPRAHLYEDRLTQPGDLVGVTKALGLGAGALAARDLWESVGGMPVLGGRVDKRTGRRSFAAEVLVSDIKP